MPNILNPNPESVSADLFGASYDYEYPEGLDLKPGSALHEFIKTEIFRRARNSHSKMQKRHPYWNEIDQLLTTYIPTSEEEEVVKDTDSRKPISIIFPYSYAVLETLLTYLVMAFLQDPIFRYEGSSPEDTIGAIMLEKVIQTHCARTKVALTLHTLFRDALAYGLGAVTPGWEVRKGFKSIGKDMSIPGLFGRMLGLEKRKVSVETVLFEGNKLDNIDPYYYFPDPNVPVHKVQDGEYSGWLSMDNYMGLLGEESYDEDLFNVKYLKHVLSKRSIFASELSDRERKFGAVSEAMDETATNRVDVIYMYVNIIPETWELGKKTTPEKWLFALGNDAVIIKARPVDMNHNMYPVAIAAPDFDGYTSTPISRIEMLYGLQGVLDWLFNSHVANVRKAINDMLVVDPYLVNIKDLEDPAPGKLIRMRRPAWGRGVENAVQQLGVTDITQANIQDSMFIVQWMQRISATDDPMMGALRRGGPERLTGEEFQGTRAGAISRLERVAMVIGMQALQDISYMFASNVQQLMTQDTYVNTTGRWQETLMREYEPAVGKMKVTPWDLLIDYDVMLRDGSIPGGGSARAWIQAYKILADHPELAQRFEMVRIFKHIAREMGAKNVEEFEKTELPETNIGVMGDEEAMREAERGNLVPFGGMQ